MSSEEDSVTAYGGLPIVLETMRALGVSDSVRKHVSVAKRERTHDEASVVEALVLLMAAGGDCLDDAKVLAEDAALCRLLERDLPSPETLRRFLYACHDDTLIAARKDSAQVAFIPEESAPLKGLAIVNRDLVQAVAARKPVTTATIDMDATIIDSEKKEALAHYKQGTGYQPMVAVWAEQDLVVAEEFRDGNVSSKVDVVRMAEAAFSVLPSSVTERFFRGDSAFYNKHLFAFLMRNNIGFTVSARMSDELKGRMERLPDAHWELFADRPNERVYISANVPYFPHEPDGLTGHRFIGICYEPKQTDCLYDDTTYLAVVTNREGSAADLLRWHWGKAATIEHVHDVMKNELGAGVLPCGRFGANAAWFRVSTLTYNVLSALKNIALPPDLRQARPKRLRFQVFVMPAVVASHARKLAARVIDRLSRGSRMIAARVALWSPAAA